MGGDSRCVSPGATRSWLIAVLGLLALFSGFGVGIVTGPLAAFDRSRAAMDVLIHGPPVVQVIPRVPPVAIAGVPVPSVIAAEQPRPSSLGSGQAVARAPAPTGPPTRLTVSGSAARAVLALPTPAESPTTPATSPETRPDAAPAPSSESAPEPPPTSSVTVPTSAAPAPATRKPAVNGAPTEPEDLSGTNVAPSAQTTDTETAEPTATTAAEPGPETSTTRARGRHGAGRAAEHPSDQPDAG